MNISIADVLLHIDESLSREDLAKLEDHVRLEDGVISASVPAGKTHLMLAAFNPECTSAKKILRRVTEQGVHAEVLGL